MRGAGPGWRDRAPGEAYWRVRAGDREFGPVRGALSLRDKVKGV